MISFENQGKLFDTLFLLFLGTLGGFIGGGITSCKIQKIIKDSIVVKHILFLIIIFFTDSFVDANKSTLIVLRNTLILYIIFIVLMKNNYKSIFIIIVVLFINKIISKEVSILKGSLGKEGYQDEEEEDEEDEEDENTNVVKQKIGYLNNISQVLLYVAAIAMVIGFVLYYLEKREEYGKTFNNITFLLGSNKCKGLL